MREVVIIGVGCTRFGALAGRSIKDLAAEACAMALADAGLSPTQVESFYLGNYGSGMLVRQELTAAMVAGVLGIGHAPATKVEAACASGGVALRHGYLHVAAGICDVALVCGVEKMSAATTEQVTQALAAAADAQAGEGSCGLTFPGFFAAMARRHMHQFGTTADHLAAVSLKNRAFAQQNPRAQFYGKQVTREAIAASRTVADPLRLFDCSPISDGAAAAVVVAREVADQFAGRRVRILASAQATGPTTLQEMAELTSLGATRRAADSAYRQAGLGPAEVDVAEVHDCFSIAEIIALDDLGFCAPGEGGPLTLAGATAAGGQVVVNPSGGLLSKGHPIGATGLAQIFELVRQLRDEAENQVPSAEIGLAHNVGGTGGVVAVHILARG